MKLFFSVMLLVASSAGLFGHVQAAEGSWVRESFICTFNDGKDMDDLMAARDFYLKQMDKAGLEPATAFVWTPFKVDVDFDFIWANDFPDLMSFARSSDAFGSSSETQAAGERFDSVATCNSNLGNRRLVYETTTPTADNIPGPALLSAAACTYRDGHGPADLGDLLGHIAGALDSVNRPDPFALYVLEPTVGASPQAADLYFYGVQRSLEDWARGLAMLQASDGYGSLSRHFQTILECGNALFFGQRVVPAGS